MRVVEKEQMKNFKLITLCLLLLGCGNKPTKENHFSTNKLQSPFYEEIFVNKGGVWAGNSYYFYLTDSTNFRELVGVCNEGENYFYEFNKDEIKAYKFVWSIKKEEKIKEKVDSSIYSVNKLIKKQNFE